MQPFEMDKATFASRWAQLSRYVSWYIPTRVVIVLIIICSVLYLSPQYESQKVFSATKPIEGTLTKKKVIQWRTVGCIIIDILTRVPSRALQLTGMNLAVLDGVDPNPGNFVGTGVLHTGAGQVGCLVRLEPNEQHQACVP